MLIFLVTFKKKTFLKFLDCHKFWNSLIFPCWGKVIWIFPVHGRPVLRRWLATRFCLIICKKRQAMGMQNHPVCAKILCRSCTLQLCKYNSWSSSDSLLIMISILHLIIVCDTYCKNCKTLKSCCQCVNFLNFECILLLQKNNKYQFSLKIPMPHFYLFTRQQIKWVLQQAR